MADATLPEKAFLVIGIMYKDHDDLNQIIEKLVLRFGKIILQSEDFEFDFTDYYEEEMGKGLNKRFLCFGKIDIEELPIIKLYTNSLEGKKRSVNIDPGYVTKDQLIVASAKPRPHRIYLSKGIYAHFMYKFYRNGVEMFRWTFADYKKDDIVDFFLSVRKKLLEKEL